MADPDYFDVADLRLLSKMGDDDKYPEARVLAVAAALTGTIETEVGTSFIGRDVTETITTCGDSALKLKTPYVLSLTTMTLNGSSVTVGDLFVDHGVVRYKGQGARFGSGLRGNAVITYVSGYSETCPADIKEPLLWAVRDELLATSETAGIDARRTSMITDQGTVNYILPGSDHPTGFPKLDARIVAYRRKLNTVTYP